jgi:RNA-directed DNA polymerase
MNKTKAHPKGEEGMSSPSNQTAPSQEIGWQDIPWRKMERRIFKLQKRIYRASKRGDVKAVRRLEKTLIKSWSAKCIAVRKVTQDNQGKKTAGVDGIKALQPTQRLKLTKRLSLAEKSKPTRRVWIPKPGKDEKRPLGIPTIEDRARQALLKMALEPEWEAKFEPNSYGFRPGRNAHDAIRAIGISINRKPKYILDADIAKCFDRINHQKLLEKVNTFPTAKRQIRAWLKAGVIDGNQWLETNEGTPQGGVISPLLANIALHGLEERLNQYIEGLKIRKNGRILGKRDLRKQLTVVRYADDFAVLHEDLDVVLRCKEIVSKWLGEMGLELKPSKTRIAHTLEKMETEEPGFNFLGFNIRQHKVGKHHSAKQSKTGEKLGFITLITPSNESVRNHYQQVARVIESMKSAPQAALIKKLNLIINGWARYFAPCNSSNTFHQLDALMWGKLRAWAKSRHPRARSSQFWVKKYWKTIGLDNWRFATNEDKALTKYSSFPSGFHTYTKVKSDKSPFDGDTVYWAIKLTQHPEVGTRARKLLRHQSGRCQQCGNYFGNEDKWEIDHIIPKSKGGKNTLDNLQLLHKHCHHKKTQSDKITGGGTHDKSYVSEEPCVGKLTSTVLKPSGLGDQFA